MDYIGLADVDSKIFNVALMKVSAFHKAQGDRVKLYPRLDADGEMCIHDELVDRVYVSSIFDFTRDFEYVLDPDAEIIRGGTGFSLDSHLPPEIESVYPDYDGFGCPYALGRLTRGCIRRCPWCVVWRQDGKVRQVAELSDFWRGQQQIRLMDDNLTALPDLFINTCEVLADAKVEVKFESLDIRLMTPEMARALKRVRRWGRVHFACDALRDEAGIVRGIEALKAGKFPTHAASFYVLIGFDTTPEEDMHRVQTLDRLGVEVFVMPFDKADPYQKRFARWVNAKPAFRSCTFAEYDVNVKKAKT